MNTVPNKQKILIIGFGSMGQRHWRNLKKLGYASSVYDIDRKKVINNQSSIASLTLANLKEFDVVFVCTPNHLHLKYALMAAKAGCHLFIEKPLSHNLKDVAELEKLCRQKRVVNLVACNMRFHPAIKYMKRYIESGKLGKFYSIAHEFGHYLPYWRKGQDYRKNYAAKKSMGGGIILDDIHEFDLLFWFNDFAAVQQSTILSDKVSDLELETEDLAIGVFYFKNKVLGMVKCDYLQQDYTRRVQIVGQKGTLEWDFRTNQIILRTSNGRKKLFEAKKYDLNEMYVQELKYFLDCVKNRKQTFNDIPRAASVLKYLL